MEALLSGTLLVDLVIAITLAEAAGLTLLYRRTGRGVPPGEWALNLLSGLCLMLTLRAALSNATGLWIVAGLTLAGLAHGADLWRRWRRRAGPA